MAGAGIVAASVVHAFATPDALSAQTILNVERFQFGELDGAHGAVQLSGSGQLGNVRFLEASVEGTVGYAGERHWPRLVLGGRFLSEDDDEAILDDRFLQLRYSYILDAGARTFHFVQIQRNETFRLRSRFLLGSGARRTVTGGDSGALDAGTGLMWEVERLDPDVLDEGADERRRTWRLANLASAHYELATGAEIWNVLYFQPALDDPRDFRLLNELSLGVPLADRVSLALGADWRHDSRPPGDLRRDDLTFRTGVSVAF